MAEIIQLRTQFQAVWNNLNQAVHKLHTFRDAKEVLPWIIAYELQVKDFVKKVETKQSISNVLEYVVREYKFTSLGELNAILKLYNVMADPGERDSRLRQHKGLLYRALDEQGNKIGAPIKASTFWHKPTLTNLEKKYAKNEILRIKDKTHVKVSIDWALRGEKSTLQGLKDKLAREGIEMMVQRSEQGRGYRVIFVDFHSKSAFKR